MSVGFIYTNLRNEEEREISFLRSFYIEKNRELIVEFLFGSILKSK